MLKVSAEENRVRFGERFSVFFLRTLRVPDDGRAYPLPPGLGEFPVHRVEDYAGCVPADWLAKGGVFIPLHQAEALWLGFEAAAWKPNAVKVGVGNINAVSGADWDETLHSDPQDYVVCPPQPWIDGFKTRSGVVRQFVAAPLGMGDTVESQLTGQDTGGIRLLVYDPCAGRFPDAPPPRKRPTAYSTEAVDATAMGVAAGGEISQKIYPDPYGLDTWDVNNSGSIWVHILNSKDYYSITGLEPPPSVIDARVYTQYGFPWFEIYDETFRDIPAAERLSRVKSLQAKQKERGETVGERARPLEIAGSQVRPLKLADVGADPEDGDSNSGE